MAETRTIKDVVRGILLSAEMGAKGDHDAYQLSDAQKGRSGWSVGRTQIDLGQQTDRHGEFRDLLKKSGKLTDQEMGSVMGDLSSIGRTKKMSAELQGKVNGVLASKDGKAMLDRWDEGQIEAMVGRVDDARAAARENPRYSSDSAFRRQVDSPAFAGAIAGHANQYENSSRIKEWLRGNEIEVNGTKVKLGDKVPGIDALADIEMSSEYLRADGKEIPKNVEAQHTRWQAIVGQLERQGDVTAEEAGAMRGTVRDRYSTEAQRTNRQDPNQHEVGAGQNLSIIAKQKGVSLEDLQRANPDKAPSKLKPGDFLRVPTSEEIEQWKRDREKAQPSKKKTSELTPEDAERQGMSAADFLKAKNEELAANGSRLPNGPQVASASAGLDRQILAEQATPVPEQKPSEPPADPKVAAMVEMSGQPVDNPGKAALLKPVETLTQSEMTDMINSAQGDYRGYRSGDPLKAHTYERVQDWHAAIRAGQTLTIPGQAPQSPSPQEIEGRMLGGKVTPVTGGTATPLPTASQWPQAAPGAGAAPDAPATPVLEQKPSEPPADPKVAAMVEMSGQPVDNPGKAALLKPVETLTQSEMTDMINSAQGDYRGYRSGDPLKAHTYERVQDWHAAMYGDGPQANDGGKPVDPTPVRAIPIRPIPHVTPQGEDLWQATGRLGVKVAEAAGTDGADNAVKSLQRGLNMLNDAKPLPARSAAYAPYTKLGPVAEDGAYGPQTDFALKHATARLGPSKVEEAFALGRFNTFAREAQRSGNAEGLESKTHAAFGPLFRDPADTQAPKLEGGALQETLNTLGPRSQDDWTPLKVDNWIGPKTTEAFGKVLQSEDADGITAAFGRGLGFL